MPQTPHIDPIAFAPAMEQPAPDETRTTAGLDTTLRGIQETVFAHSGQAVRGVHAKSHGLLTATLTVPGDLPPLFRQGMFASPGHYKAIMRFSTIPGDVLTDDVSVPRGLALKVIGVAGERLPGSEGDVTQDFLMVNGPAFGAPNPKEFLTVLKLAAGTTNRAEGLKVALSHAARGAEALLEAFGRRSGLISRLGGHPATNILGETFFSQTPYLFGPYYAKFSIKPVSAALTALAGVRLDTRNHQNAIRDAVIDHFAHGGGEWALRVQLATDAAAMPVEDPSVAWPEGRSPFVTVAHLVAPAQDAWSEAKRREIEDGYAFSPWHGLAAHRPLGGVNRVRRETYRNSAAFRRGHNGCPMREPAA